MQFQDFVYTKNLKLVEKTYCKDVISQKNTHPLIERRYDRSNT